MMMKYYVTINGRKFEVEMETAAEQQSDPSFSETNSAGEAVPAPMPGTISSIKVNEGQNVRKGDVLFILEAMKMENEIMAPRDAVVAKLLVAGGTAVKTGDRLLVLK